MPSIYSNVLIAFIMVLTGLLEYRSHVISSLLCLEGIILSLFVLSTLIILNIHFTISTIIPIILIVFTTCEATVGLALLVIISNTYGLDHIQNLNLLQC